MTIPDFDSLPRDCWATINTAQLSENLRRLKAVAGVPVMAVVKANGYGHGYENAACAFIAGGASYLGVATLSEGLLLRKLGIEIPVLVVGGMLPADIVLAAQAALDFFVWQPDHIQALRDMPKGSGLIRAHLKVDTGMGRSGCMPNEALAIAQALKTISGVELTGLCTHFASADIPGIDDTARQIEKFDQVIAALAVSGIRPRIIHAANSPGTLYFVQARYDMVRVGITAYGIPPDTGLKIPDGVKPALGWRARITSTKILPAGHGISYGSEYKLPAPTRVGVLPVGYADGYRRTPKNVNSVLVEGRECKVLGRVCMDQCMIDLGGFGDITGAEAILVGEQGGKNISVDDLAQRWGTISYEVLTGIAMRVPRRVMS